MRRLRLLTVLVVCMFVGTVAFGPRAVVAGTFEQWASFNDGLWGSDITCLWRSASGTLFAGTEAEGIYATDDGGLHWRWSGTGMANLGTTAEPSYRRVLFIEGTLTQGVVYAGTTTGLMVSRDGGTVWTPAGGVTGSMVANCIAAMPLIPGGLLLGTNDGVFSSVDGGATWVPRNVNMSQQPVLAIVPDWSMPGGVFACTAAGIFKSLDGGETWRRLSTGLNGLAVQCLVQDSKRADMLFAGTSHGVYRTYDGGDTWTLLGTETTRASTLGIRIDSFDQALIGAVTKTGILLSRDGGETWQQSFLSGVPVSCGLLTTFAPRLDAILGTGRGVMFVSDSAGELRDQGQGLIDVTATAFDSNSALMYAVRGSSLYQKTVSGSWEVVESSLGNARAYGLAVDRNEPRLMYAATEYGILRSTDGGKSWVQLTVTPSDVRGRIQAVAIDPADGRFVYAGNDYGLYRSDRGFKESWTAVGPQNTGAIVGIAVVPTDGRTLFVASATKLWKTTDRCQTWLLVSDQLAPLSMTSLAVSDDGRTLYAGSLGGALRSTDGGVTWQPLGVELRGLLVNSVVPGPSGQLMAGTSVGFFLSRTVQDNAGPSIQLETPADGTSVTAPQVIVSGVARDAESGLERLTVNGAETAVDPMSGHFSTTLVAKQGTNRIVLRAEDLAGNVTEISIAVSYSQHVVLELVVGSSVMRILPDHSASLDSPPVIIGGRTLVAIRPIVEALGGTVVWSAVDRKVTVAVQGTSVELWIDKNTATVNGSKVPVDRDNATIVPKIVSGRTMLPLRFVAEALGAKVDWDASAKRITITYPAP